MTDNRLKPKWRQMRGRIKLPKAKLTNNYRDRISGRFDIFVGELQERSGHTRQQAVRVIDRGITDYQDRLKKIRSGRPSK